MLNEVKKYEIYAIHTVLEKTRDNKELTATVTFKSLPANDGSAAELTITGLPMLAYAELVPLEKYGLAIEVTTPK